MKMQALYCLLSALSLCACSPRTTTVEAVASDTYFSIPIEDSMLYLQLALTDGERSQGLMFRDTLPEDHGMLFLFKNSGKQSFWMRNTRIPLDLAYFDAQGKLLEIHPLYPYDENAVYSHSKEVLIVVEMNRDWFSRKNILPGAMLDMEALAQAVSKRGYSPSDYSLKAVQ